MLRYVVSSASNYFYLPIEDESTPLDEDDQIPAQNRHIDSKAAYELDPSSPCDSPPLPSSEFTAKHHGNGNTNAHEPAIAQILAQSDLYAVLGLAHGTTDAHALRRAYLARTKMCHPDKFAGDPAATLAFQKVSLAYSILADPARRRRYDAAPSDFAAQGMGGARAEETLRGVVLGVFNDFLDGDMEVVRTLLRALDDFNPALRLNDEGIESVLVTLQAIRERLITCRALSHALVATLSHLAETQHALGQQPYLALRPRARLSLQLARITLGLPLALEDVLRRERRRPRARRRDSARWAVDDEKDDEVKRVQRRRVLRLIEGLVSGLEMVEKAL
ncbi:DnaJ-domain-containing protein [Peniophora sp. CONT]|nr:DnaJ-domain-containing protein [Peniophora sp. CONT]